MNAFQFDANLSTAATIPASWYTDPARWPLEQACIFRRTWQYACALERLRLDFPQFYA